MYTDEQIRAFMNTAYKEASKHFEVFGVFLKGSQNYGTATDTSDVDLVVVTIPSFYDLACEQIRGYYLDSFEKNSETDYGTVQLTGIRDFMRNLLKPNIANHEFLFSDYVMLNEKYAGYWLGGIIKNRERLINISLSNLVRACVGSTHQALKQAFPEDKKEVEEYRSSRLVYAMCCVDYIKAMMSEEQPINPFKFAREDEMRELKEHPVSYEDALTIKQSIEEEADFINKTLSDMAYNPDANARYTECQEIVCTTLENILRDSLTHQLLPGEE